MVASDKANGFTGQVNNDQTVESSSIIDTLLYVDNTIEITLAPSDVFMQSSFTTLYASVTDDGNGITTTAGTTPALTSSQGTGCTLSNIGYQIVNMTCYNTIIKLWQFY